MPMLACADTCLYNLCKLMANQESIGQAKPASETISFRALGFDDKPYVVTMEAGALAIATVTETLMGSVPITVDQVAIVRFIAVHVGQGFKPTDAYPYLAGGTGLKDRFNGAAYDKQTGLYTVFSKATGDGNLWFRDGKYNQVGQEPAEINQDYAPEQQTSPQPTEHFKLLGHGKVEILSTAVELDNEQLKTLTTLLRKVVEASGEVVKETDIVEQLCADLHIPGEDARRLLHATVNMIHNRVETDRAMEFTTVGRGAKEKMAVWVNPKLLPDKLEPSRKENQQTESKIDVDWQLKDEGLVADGKLIVLKPEALALLKTMRDFGSDRPVSMSKIARSVNCGKQMENSSFLRFLVWADWAFHEVNTLAPVIVIDNQSDPGRRTSKTRYSYNWSGKWGALVAVEPGTVLIPSNPKIKESNILQIVDLSAIKDS